MDVCDLDMYSVHMCMGNSGIGGGLPDFKQIFFFFVESCSTNS